MSYCVCYVHCNIIINYNTLWLRLYSVHRQNNKHDTLQLYHPRPAVVVVRVECKTKRIGLDLKVGL